MGLPFLNESKCQQCDDGGYSCSNVRVKLTADEFVCEEVTLQNWKRFILKIRLTDDNGGDDGEKMKTNLHGYVHLMPV